MTQQATQNTIEAEGKSLEEARRNLKAMVPRGMRILKENVLSDGRPLTLRGVGHTEDEAMAECRKQVPKGARVVTENLPLPGFAVAPPPGPHAAYTEKVRVKAGDQAVTVEADSPEEAKRMAQEKAGASAVAKHATLTQSARKGFLGVSRRSAAYEVQVWHPCEVEITLTRETARVRATLGAKPQARCDKCGGQFDKDKLYPIQIMDASTGRLSPDMNVCMECNLRIASQAVGMMSVNR